MKKKEFEILQVTIPRYLTDFLLCYSLPSNVGISGEPLTHKVLQEVRRSHSIQQGNNLQAREALEELEWSLQFPTQVTQFLGHRICRPIVVQAELLHRAEAKVSTPMKFPWGINI